MHLLSINMKRYYLIPGPWTVVFFITMSLFSLFVKYVWAFLF